MSEDRQKAADLSFHLRYCLISTVLEWVIAAFLSFYFSDSSPYYEHNDTAVFRCH